MKERERTQQKLQDIRAQAKDLEYALKRLLETGTVISPELDEQIPWETMCFWNLS